MFPLRIAEVGGQSGFRRFFADVHFQQHFDRFADLVALRGDPLRDITEVERALVVLKGGTVVKNGR